MVVEVRENYFIDMDKVQAIFWVPDKEVGVVMLIGGNTAITDKEEWAVIKKAFIFMHKSYMYDDKMKRIHYIKREGGE